jgi:hypothetical protein
MLSAYTQYLHKKSHLKNEHGFDPVFMPSFLFDFQQSLVDWACRQGRSAMFADCGLGKTAMQLTWAKNVCRKTNGNVLVLTPLAVGQQTIKEGEKFGIEARVSHDGTAHRGITVTNYEQLHKFSHHDFQGVVCDESSILKNFDGTRKDEITRFMRKVPYRLLATATAAPNDFIELGTSSEALGGLGYMDMLSKFFKNDQNNCATNRAGRFTSATKWRLKGHAEEPFWRWICSWARAVRNPSDLGFDDNAFILPPLVETQHVVESHSLADGYMFALPAIGLKEQREETRRTIKERCEKAADIANQYDGPVLVWCNLNDEGDLLESLIPDSVQVSGGDSNQVKEDRLTGFADGKYRVLVTKPKIGAWGLNYQHCNKVVFFPTHSYEQYYQSIRRCWRFGQKRPVSVDIITTEGGLDVLENLQRKSKQADDMFANLVRNMNNILTIDKTLIEAKSAEVPSWM